MNENNQPQSQQTPSESALDKAPTRAPREDTTTFEERGLMESKRQRFNERLNQVMNGKPDEQSKAHERIKALEKKCHDYAIAQEGNLAKLDELNAKQAELVAENERLKADVDRLKAAPDYDPLTSEEVWKLIETYKKAGWYDDEFVLEIERQASELDKLRTENEKLQNSNTVLAEGYRRLNKALEEVELHLGPYKWCNINEYIECKRIISAAVNPPEL